MPRFNRPVHISEAIGRIALAMQRQRQGFVGIAMSGGAAQVIRHPPKPAPDIGERGLDGGGGVHIHEPTVAEKGSVTNGG